MLSDTDPRPCHQLGCQPNACATAHYARIVSNQAALHGPWAGWRLAGRDPVSPDRQRISPERLRGLLFRDASEKRLAVNRLNALARSTEVISLPARELFQGHA